MTKSNADLLKRAILEGVDAKYKHILANSQVDATCSGVHHQKLDVIMGFDTRRVQRSRKIKKIVTVILIAAMIGIACLTTYAYRNQIRELFIQIFDDAILLEYPGEQPTGLVDEIYQITYIPDGYEIVEKQENPMGVFCEWHDASGNLIIFRQMPINTMIGIDGDDGSSSLVQHGELQIYCREKNGIKRYFWNDGKYVMNIVNGGGHSLEEVLKMIDSITVKELTEKQMD